MRCGPKAVCTLWQGHSETVSALSADPKWSGTRVSTHAPPSPSTLRNDMKLPKFLRPPKTHLRNRSKARSEIGPIEGPGEVDPAVPRPTESTPDLRVETSISPASSPLAPRNQGSNGMGIVLFQLIHLSPSVCITQTPTPIPIEPCLPPEGTRAPSRTLEATPPT